MRDILVCFQNPVTFILLLHCVFTVHTNILNTITRKPQRDFSSLMFKVFEALNIRDEKSDGGFLVILFKRLCVHIYIYIYIYIYMHILVKV